eukprot:s6169_g4.t1
MIETHSTVPIDYIASPAAVQRSHKLYAVLAGLIKRRGLQVIHRVAQQNGYESLRQLMQLYQPTSRTRSLGILTTLAQLLELERMIDEYERSSNKQLDDDFKTSILLKCITGQMKNHLATVLTEAALRYERMQMKWTPASLFSTDRSGSKSAKDDVQPMEVDRLQKGKGGKNENKGKRNKGKQDKGYSKGGKNNGWQQQPRDSWNQNKGKQDKGKQGKGKQYGFDSYSGKGYGYGGNQWQDRRVQQVQDQTGQHIQHSQQPFQPQQQQWQSHGQWQAPPQPSNATTVPSFSSAASQASTMSTAVRRVYAERCERFGVAA